MIEDLRYALRRLRHAPGFAAASIAILALGLGANIAVFTLVSGILLRPLPYADAGRLVSIQLDTPRLGAGFFQAMNYANMLELRDRLGGRMPVGANFEGDMVSLTGPGGIRGRSFTADDSASSPVAVVVNKAFADRLLPGVDPVGHIYSMGKGRLAEARIVGEIGDTRQARVTEATTPEVYFCLEQVEPGTPLYGIASAFLEVAIRGRLPADLLRAQFDRALHEVTPEATTTDVKTLHEAVEDSFGSTTLMARLLEAIAAVGLHGLVWFAVAGRTREIGLRLALGATGRGVLAMFVGRALRPVAAGLVAGALLAWSLASLARSYIFGVDVHDPATFLAVTAVLALASLAAAGLAARRAAEVDPLVALRTE